MHSFHPNEKYARNVGIRLGKLDVPYATIIESPKKRDYQRLVARYNAKWIVDLHNDLQPYNYDIKHLLAMMYLSTIHNQQKDEERKQIIRRWIRKNYSPNEMGVYPVSFVKKLAFNKPPNFIGIELYPHNSVAKSVEFVKELTKHLYASSI